MVSIALPQLEAYATNMCSSGSATIDEALAGIGGLDGEVVALVELRDRVDAALLERVGVFDAAEQYKDDGAFSFATWLRARADVSRSESQQLGRLARLLRTMPVTDAAVAEAKLSVAKARLLASVINERTRATFDEHESFLVDMVQGLDVDAAAMALTDWKRKADTDGPDPGDPTRNRASITTGFNGRWHFEGDFDPASGAIIKSVLDATVDRMHQDGCFNDLEPENNTAGRRYADATVEMALRSSGRNPDQPSVHPDLIVLVPVDRLIEGKPDLFGASAEIIGHGPIDLVGLYRLGVLGTVSLMTVDDEGRPLYLGRQQRLASCDQWVFQWVRDRGCVIPGCDRPAAWCHSHHRTYWEHGGTTDIGNLCLVCTAHHHLIHDQHWTIDHLDDGTWTLTRPDGTVVTPPRYPGHQPPRRAGPPG